MTLGFLMSTMADKECLLVYKTIASHYLLWVDVHHIHVNVMNHRVNEKKSLLSNCIFLRFYTDRNIKLFAHFFG